MAKTLRKPLFWTNLVVLVIFGFVVANVIFGFTNPPSDPPNPPGAVRAVNAEVGIGINPIVGNALTVNGVVDVQSNRITSVADPIASSDAATKSYVDAQGGGGAPEAGAVTTVTLFGRSSTQTQVDQSNVFRGPNGAVPPGCHTNPGWCQWFVQNVWGALPVSLMTSVPPAGEGVPACTSLPVPSLPVGKWTWFEIFKGYGPHETVVLNFAAAGQQPVRDPPTAEASTWQIPTHGTSGWADPGLSDVLLGGVGIADSVCSNSIEQTISVMNSIVGGPSNSSQVVGAGNNSACSADYCNTCRICGLYKTP